MNIRQIGSGIKIVAYSMLGIMAIILILALLIDVYNYVFDRPAVSISDFLQKLIMIAGVIIIFIGFRYSYLMGEKIRKFYQDD